MIDWPWGNIVILARVRLLSRNFWIMYKGARHALVYGTLWNGMRVGTVWSHGGWWCMWGVGIGDKVWVDIVVLRRQIEIRGIVPRHDALVSSLV